MRSQDLMHPVREIRTPQGTGKICELYHNGSEYFVLVKIRRKVYTFPLSYLIAELTKDIPSAVLEV